MKNNLDQTDKKILTALQHNARVSNAELSSAVNLSQTPCLRRLRKLENSGVIEGYKVKLDDAALGINVWALVFVKLDKNTSDNAASFERAINNLSEITECCVLAGSHDYLLRVGTESLRSFEIFLKEKLAGVTTVEDIESTIILNQVLTREPSLNHL